jgi:hypothetical protein
MVKRYQRGNQKPKVKEGQTTQWSKDTKGVIRSRKSKKERQHNGQKKTTKEPKKIYKTLHRKIKIEQQEPYPKRA